MIQAERRAMEESAGQARIAKACMQKLKEKELYMRSLYEAWIRNV